MDAYNAAERAGTNALGYALECGKQLNLAKETVKADRGKWKKWCGEKLKVSEETERLYRRLAEAVAKKEDVFAKCKSIRDAMKHLSGLDKDLNPKPAAPTQPRPTRKTGNSVTGLAPPETDTPSGGLEAELENAAADEIIGNIHDADKLEDVAKATLAKLSPDKVCDALIGAWDTDQLRNLNRRLIAHLNKLMDASSNSPNLARRGVAVEQPSSTN
jgi:hypothetical protein